MANLNQIWLLNELDLNKLSDTEIRAKLATELRSGRAEKTLQVWLADLFEGKLPTLKVMLARGSEGRPATWQRLGRAVSKLIDAGTVRKAAVKDIAKREGKAISTVQAALKRYLDANQADADGD